MKQHLVALLGLLLITSCGQKQENTETESRVFIAERETFFNSLRDPEIVAAQLVPGLSGFDATLLNDPVQVYRFTGNEILAAANLGVYLADLNYCILFKQREESKKYFDAIFELSKIIQVEKVTLEFLMNRYEANLEQYDSVTLWMKQLLEKATLGLQGTDRERLAGIAMAGYQIENLHLALSTLDSFPTTLTADQIKSKDLILKYIIDQRSNFDVIYNFVRTNSDPLDPDRNPNYPFFDNALRELIGVYVNITEEPPQLNELKEKVDAIRTKIVNP